MKFLQNNIEANYDLTTQLHDTGRLTFQHKNFHSVHTHCECYETVLYFLMKYCEDVHKWKMNLN